MDTFVVDPGVEYAAFGGGYEATVPNEAKGLLVLELKLYSDGHLHTHLDMVFCPPELN